MGLHWPDYSWDFSSDFSLISSWNRFSMGCYGVNLLLLAFKIVVHSALFVSALLGLIVFEWLLRGVIFGVVLKHFTLLQILPGPCTKHFFCTGRIIDRMACMISLALAIADLLGVGWQGCPSYLLFPDKTGMLGFCPLDIFRRCSSFVDLLCNLHALKHSRGTLLGTSLKIPSL